MAPCAALEETRKNVAGEKEAGVINFVIRGPQEGQAVTVKAAKISYAIAID